MKDKNSIVLFCLSECMIANDVVEVVQKHVAGGDKKSMVNNGSYMCTIEYGRETIGIASSIYNEKAIGTTIHFQKNVENVVLAKAVEKDLTELGINCLNTDENISSKFPLPSWIREVCV